MKTKDLKTLKIVIKGEWLDLILSGKKKIEYREQSDFWVSRLYDENDKKRKYDQIEFINGYNKNARRLLTKYEGFSSKSGLFNIRIGKIIK